MALISASCGKIQETGLLYPITFKAEAGVPLLTKADSPLQTQVNTFTLFGSKTVSSSPSPVFNGYTVNYSAPSWKYKDVDGQEIQYWDYKADVYSFSAVTSGFSVTSGTARIENATTSGADFLALESNNTVPKQDFGNTVNLRFSRLLSRIAVAFYEDMEDWEVKNVNFSLDGTFVNRGDYRVRLSDGYFIASNLTSDSSINGSISGTIGTTKETANASGFTNVLPYSSDNPITLTISSYTLVDSEGDHTISPGPRIEIPFEKWDLNHSYTYIFRISEATVTLDMTINLNIHDWMPESYETILE